MTTEQNPAKLQSMARQRRLWLIAASGVLGLAAIGYGTYWGMKLRFQESTDDAYVAGNVVQITPQISGTVVAIGADNTQFVQAGQTIVQLDRADAKVALDQVEAQLARTVREVRNLFSTSASESQREGVGAAARVRTWRRRSSRGDRVDVMVNSRHDDDGFASGTQALWARRRDVATVATSSALRRQRREGKSSTTSRRG
jgi:membrane fusion protein (multidrug efflux system)